jgi:hypothetical protein
MDYIGNSNMIESGIYLTNFKLLILYYNFLHVLNLTCLIYDFVEFGESLKVSTNCK